jgi:restriction endonuclease, S subunit
MHEGAEKRIMAYWDRMRGAISSDDYINASVLIDEVKKSRQNQVDEENPESIYASLLEAADKLGVRNPFNDKEHFFLIYQESKQSGKMDWEYAIAQFASSTRRPILPPVLIDVYMERFKKNPKTVLLAEAERFVPYLQKMVDEHINAEFVLTTQNESYAKIFKNLFEGYANVEILMTDIYQYEFVNRRFDLILSCPAFGGRTLVDNKSFMCREYDMVALENLSLHLNSGGELVIVLPGRITFASGKINDLRQFIQQNYTIREIAELPEGTMTYCGIKVYLLDIENTRPGDDDIVIRRYISGEKKTRQSPITSLKIADDTFVMLSELEEQGDWSVDHIFSRQDEEYLNYQNSDVRKELIGNVAQVFRGKSVRKKDPAGSIGVVNISNIGEYELDYEGFDHLEEEEHKVANYLLQEGDVLLPARGTAIRTAVFHMQKYPCIASSNVIVIRPDARMLDSTYLKIFLDSPIGNKLISGAQQGMTVMNISYKDLNILEVPIPSLAQQKEVAAEYTDELKRYKNTIDLAEKRWTDVLCKLQHF